MSIDFSNEETVYLEQLLNEVCGENINNGSFKKIINKFICTIENLKENGLTAKLWIQYFEMIMVVKQFIVAERSGDFELHLQCVKRMLPYFHASGHFLYAKTAHLYLQDMLQLETKIDVLEYDLFTRKGYFTIRRTDTFWSGI